MGSWARLKGPILMPLACIVAYFFLSEDTAFLMRVSRKLCSPWEASAASWVRTRLFSVQNHSLSNLIHHEWMNHQLNNWFLLIPKTKLGCDTSHYFFQVDHLVGWIKRNQKDSIRIIFLSDFWVPIALIHFFDSGIKRNQIFEWAVFTQLKTA